MQWRTGATIATLISAVLITSYVGAETLQEGAWKGRFVTYDGTRYKVKYNVKYNNEQKEDFLAIEMINMDLEPVSKFTYYLTDIIVEDDKISFKIPKEFEIKECVLTKDKNGYIGTCISSAGDSDETSEITMSPVEQEPLESAPQ